MEKGKNNTQLTPREKEVLSHIQDGMTHKQIADKLIVSPSTVRKHMENSYKKLQAHNKMEAVQKALQLKLIDRK